MKTTANPCADLSPAARRLTLFVFQFSFLVMKTSAYPFAGLPLHESANWAISFFHFSFHYENACSLSHPVVWPSHSCNDSPLRSPDFVDLIGLVFSSFEIQSISEVWSIPFVFMFILISLILSDSFFPRLKSNQFPKCGPFRLCVYVHPDFVETRFFLV